MGMDAGGRTPELWVIPADGKPRSLGVVPEKAAAAMTVPPEHRAMLAEGVTLAVSLEPEGGSPTGAPTGPVVMTGTMSAV
jgi:anti-sigma-K factor RskA